MYSHSKLQESTCHPGPKSTVLLLYQAAALAESGAGSNGPPCSTALLDIVIQYGLQFVQGHHICFQDKTKILFEQQEMPNQ